MTDGPSTLRSPMKPRSPDEPHRAATPLELFFDLVFVVAIAQAAAGLHHAIAGAHTLDGLIGYLPVFFGIWWAWMNFTWFASAYDCDDVPYRIAVFVQLSGAVVLAAGVTPAFEEFDYTIPTLGYVIMRMAIVVQWLRAASADPPRRTTAHRYAGGITLVQIGWVSLLFAPAAIMPIGFGLLVLGELAVPVWAEQAEPTTWHPHHIAERYGLLTIIVLGESILATTLAVEAAISAGEAITDLLPAILGGLLVVFTMWWFYFYQPIHGLLTSVRRAFVWGYGHYVVYASAAAAGAGLAVSVDHAVGHTAISDMTAGMAVAVPVAVYLVSLWMLHGRVHGPMGGLVPLAAALVLGTPFTPWPVLLTGAVLTGLLAIKLLRRRRNVG